MRRCLRFVVLALVFTCLSGVSTAQSPLSRLKGNDRPRIGLVLGGGGAKGAAEIGVLKALEEEGLEFDYIAGTSIGSIVGALYSCGYRASDLENLFLSQSWLNLMTDRNESDKRIFADDDGVISAFGIPIYRPKRVKDRKQKKNRGYEISGFGLNNGDKIVALFDSLVCCKDSISFNSLPIPFACVATEMRRQEPVVLRSGLLPVAMRASMAIPGMFKPVKIGDQVLVDGGMQNNLPVDVVKSMGAEYVISIDLTQTKHEPRDFSLKELVGIGGILDWVVSRPDWKSYEANVKASDLYFNPPLEGYDVMDFTKAKIQKMIQIGYAHAKGVIKDFRR